MKNSKIFLFEIVLCIVLIIGLTAPLWRDYVAETIASNPFIRKVEKILPEEDYNSRTYNQKIKKEADYDQEIKKEKEDYEMRVIITAYYKPEKNQSFYAEGNYDREVRMNGNGINFSEKTARVGTVAADPNVIPLGSVIYIPGYGKAVVEDIGSAIIGKRIDVFMGSGEQALRESLKWGKKEVKITILRWGEKK